MSTATAKIEHTPEDLLKMPDAKIYELVDGKLVERNMGMHSSRVEGVVFHRVYEHCQVRDLGPVWPGTASYQCFPFAPRQLRRPDISFIIKNRWSQDLEEEGHCSIAPDFAAEVLSPDDLAYEVDAKVEEYLRAGVKLVWVINPELRTVQIHRADGSTSKLHENDDISGEDVIDGFRCKVAEFFPVKMG